MYCTKCGKQANFGDVYCSGCGKRLRSRDAAPKGTVKRRGGTLALLLIFTIALTGAWTLLRETPEPALPVTEPAKPPAASPENPGQAAPSSVQETTVPTLTEDAYLAEEITVEAGVKTVVRCRYDENGLLTWKDDGTGYVHTYSYRPGGILEKEGISCAGEPCSVILYDDFGYPLRESDLEAYTKLYSNTYDAEGRPVFIQVQTSDGVLLEELCYTYAQDGSFTLDYIDYAEGLIHCHKFTSYDCDGRILTQSQDLDSGMAITVRTDRSYDGFGNPVRTEYRYDDGDVQITTLTEYENTVSADGTLAATTVYVSEQLISREKTSHSPRTADRIITCSYDDQSRLIRQETRGAEDDWSFACTWEYDDAGKLLRYAEGDNDLVKTYTYLPLEQLQYP